MRCSPFSPWSATEDAAAFLLAEVTLTDTPADVVRLWKLACTLNVAPRFVAQMRERARGLLGASLRAELLAAREWLDVRVDVRLEQFADGRDVDEALLDSALRPLALPKSRLTDLLGAERFLGQSHRGLGDHYFQDLAEGCALASGTFDLAEALQALPAGRAVFAAFDVVVRERPELIATFAWHPSLHASGAFLLTQLPQQLTGARKTVELGDEWEEVQRLGRELLLLGDRSSDWCSLLALGVHDEGFLLTRKHRSLSPLHLRERPLDAVPVWQAVAADADRSATAAESLSSYLRERVIHDDAGLIFALRFLQSLQQSGHVDLATPLAASIVEAYAASLALEHETLSPPDLLCAYGDLISGLRATLLTASNSESWRTLLRPFTLRAYIDEAARDTATSYDSTTVGPWLDVPRVLRAHAETLAALAEASGDVEEPLDALLELYFVDHEKTARVEAFSWNALARTTKRLVKVYVEFEVLYRGLKLDGLRAVESKAPTKNGKAKKVISPHMARRNRWLLKLVASYEAHARYQALRMWLFRKTPEGRKAAAEYERSPKRKAQVKANRPSKEDEAARKRAASRRSRGLPPETDEQITRWRKAYRAKRGLPPIEQEADQTHDGGVRDQLA